MISAIDTNILLDILLPNEAFCDLSARALQDASEKGTLVVCDLVYAELCVHFDTQRACDAFLESVGIRIQSLHREAHFLASRAYRQYRLRGGKQTKILPDFLIGAHAQVQATRLISRDRGFYRDLFPSLDVCDPSAD